MKKNSRGFTVLELIVSFSITMVIIIFLFEILIMLKDMYVSLGVKTTLLSKQSVIIDKLNSELMEKKLIVASRCGNDCLDFYFNDNTHSKLIIDRENNLLTYGNYATELLTGSKFGNIEIKSELLYDVEPGLNDSIISIKVPIYHELIKEKDFGINAVYQYNSQEVSVTDVYINDIVDNRQEINLIGSSNMIAFKGIGFSDPGYYVVTSDNQVVLNDPSVTVTGIVGTEVGKTYRLSYTLYDASGAIKSSKIRKVTLLDTTTDFDFTGGTQSYTAPATGIYRLEVWGAQGGSGGTGTGGKGGYTTGQITLKKGDHLSVYVGGKGDWGGDGDLADRTIAGYNGGGAGGGDTNSESMGTGGGGATDIRYKGTSLNSRIIVAGGGGGASIYSYSSNTNIGGAGGGLSGATGSSSSTSYNGLAGTATSGGAGASSGAGSGTIASAGSIGIGGSGGIYINSGTYAGGGGGGGYYGGGGGIHGGVGGGGSGYCGDLDLCTTYSGTTGATPFSKTNGIGTENGHEGNGYAKITLLSVTSAIDYQEMTMLVDEIEVPVKEAYGATWLRVFHHNNKKGNILFTSNDEFLKSDTIDKESVLFALDRFKSNDNSFEFLLEYPNDSQNEYNRFKQTSNFTTSETVTGYQALNISWSSNNWSGLSKSTNGRTFADGNTGTDWNYAIGARTSKTVANKTGIPSYNGKITEETVNLWVRIDDYLNSH